MTGQQPQHLWYYRTHSLSPFWVGPISEPEFREHVDAGKITHKAIVRSETRTGGKAKPVTDYPSIIEEIDKAFTARALAEQSRKAKELAEAKRLEEERREMEELEAEAVRIAEQRREESHPLVKVIDQHGRVIVKQLAAINKQLADTQEKAKAIDSRIGCVLGFLIFVFILQVLFGIWSSNVIFVR